MRKHTKNLQKYTSKTMIHKPKYIHTIVRNYKSHNISKDITVCGRFLFFQIYKHIIFRCMIYESKKLIIEFDLL
jgi:hypothetical protein